MATPFVNLNNGEIHNCKPGSWAYLHEQGHLEYDKTKGHYKMTQGYALMVWVFVTTLGLINKYMFYLALPLCLLYIGLEIYEEVWCNRYAKAHITAH